MEAQRKLILIGLLVVSFMLWQQWNQSKTPQTAAITTTQSGAFVPESTTATDVPGENGAAPASQRQLLKVRSDVLELTIDTLGGDVVDAKLLTQALEQGSDEPFTLLMQRPDRLYVAQSGLIGRNGPDSNPKGRPTYQAQASEYQLADGQDELVVPMSFTDEQGVTFTKRYVLKRGQFAINVDYQISNPLDTPVEVQFYGQLKQTMATPPGEGGHALMASAFRGGAFSSENERYKKVTFDDMKETNLATTTAGGWVGMLQHYFVTAWAGAEQAQNQLYTRAVNNGQDAIIGLKAPLTKVDAAGTATLGASLWIGPKLQDEMAAVANHLDLTVDYGWLWFIAQPLFKLLQLLHGLVSNWGVAIVLITLIVRGAMYPLTKAQYTSMAKMRMLQPKLTALRERFGDDRQRMSQAMMELYKQEKVNPLGGCFPILIQMPIFIALYWTLMESVELRHAPFALWITDLSVKDPFFVLPLLMGASMWFIQKMSPTTVTDPMQQKVMQFMPIIFTFMFLWFPAGLTLYWLVSNVVTITQQSLIFRQLAKKGLHTKKA